ncbi:MAG: hypothetical protein K8R46_06985, partial [Pirellulales bacterium]|nr:hypothetical protein [Pirellulales bacterium]
SGMDYAVVEGFKDSRLPKIVLGDLELPDEVARLDDAVDLPDEVLTNLLEIIEQQPEYHTLDSLIVKVESGSSLFRDRLKLFDFSIFKHIRISILKFANIYRIMQLIRSNY